MTGKTGPASLDARRRRNGPGLPAVVVVVTLDTNGRPFSEQSASAFVDVINHAADPGVQVCRAYIVTPVTGGNDGR